VELVRDSRAAFSLAEATAESMGESGLMGRVTIALCGDDGSRKSTVLIAPGALEAGAGRANSGAEPTLPVTTTDGALDGSRRS